MIRALMRKDKMHIVFVHYLERLSCILPSVFLLLLCFCCCCSTNYLQRKISNIAIIKNIVAKCLMKRRIDFLFDRGIVGSIYAKHYKFFH
ncbi:hypothetical protein RIF29_15156 [Crotalaria pallida]|uniref:Uncharacterized protein n=1 Tax=Crotalaria pallida TaxID=3830 RepID=A0AAN9FEN6_CROPI